MRNVNPSRPQPDPDAVASNKARFRLLLTEDRAHSEGHWTQQLPAVLKPMGIDALVASSGAEALDIIKSISIHAAVIDLATPTGNEPAQGSSASASNQSPNNSANTSSGGGGGGLWLMQVIQRLPAKPPVVIVNSRSYSQRQVQRSLNQALMLGAFSVINRPVKLDTLLATFQRLLERAYNNTWPPPESSTD